MNLYEIDASLAQAFEAAIDPDTGEILNEEMADAFEQLQIDRDKKIEGTACLIKNLRAEAAALKAEKDSLAARQRTAENKANSLSKYLAGYLNGDKFKTARAAISWRKSEAVEVVDASQLPAEYLVQQAPTPNKPEIKAALKAGNEIPGARLIENHNMIIK